MPRRSPAPRAPIVAIEIPIRGIFVALLVIDVVIVVIYDVVITTLWSGVALPSTVAIFLERWDVDAEVAVPTWYSTLLLAAAGLLALGIGLLGRTVRRARWGWWVAIGIVLVALSADEASAFHEIAVRPVQTLLHITAGPFLFAWVVPAAIVVVITFVVFARFYFGLPPDTRIGVGVGAAVFLVGALGMEMIQGAFVYQLEVPGTGTSFALDLLSGAEELLEITGSTLLIVAFLRHLARHTLEPGGATLRFAERTGSSSA
jgi:hypothetical protein